MKKVRILLTGVVFLLLAPLIAAQLDPPEIVYGYVTFPDTSRAANANVTVVINTSADADPGPCGACASCTRAAAGRWIDFEEIVPEGAEEGKPGSIKIEQLRALRAGMGFGAHEGPFRVTLIESAEHMTPQAANSLLKVLEEPPPGRIFILTAGDPSLLLPTLVSRCQKVTLRPFDGATLARLAERSGAAPERAKAAAALAQGSWKRALALASDDAWETRTKLMKFLESPKDSLSELVDWGSSEAANASLLVDLLEQAVRDRMAAGTSSFLEARAERLAEARRQLQAPLNRKVLLQDLLIPWVAR